MSGLAGTFVPRPDFGSRHQTVIPAPVEAVWAAWQEMEQAGGEGWGPIVRALFTVRRQLGRLKSGGGEVPEEDLRDSFLLLAEDPPREMVRGIVGQWWTMGAADGRPDVTGPGEFLAFDEPGYAKATFSMRFTADAATGGTRVVTETRVLCLDEAARRAMRRYWRLIEPFSSLVRRMMLRRLRKRAVA
ncbi:hypothetical protein HRW18_32145 [Streptomyces lunaelactis]|uniref:hypothetical protein n=1 Tax=Streptomyces lunaelactis TaxID=1535768 RepID=UPI001584B81F|nr:hypothetical protein [Streptomyces lunaelactis]NUK12543.1 hypothetical protein [Streptomyces lunaelactis]NUK37428.1 hypothetical protein [Streptomyces lunaelactis]NUK45988.1 hypothetical protein [Streptomyces lunaelactis]NUK55384.1 hypothetical protein [Streptomyces lunaelactis]NUK60507.1 hypothetical protein [Streptomyces lunaelactis]